MGDAGLVAPKSVGVGERLGFLDWVWWSENSLSAGPSPFSKVGPDPEGTVEFPSGPNPLSAGARSEEVVFKTESEKEE